MYFVLKKKVVDCCKFYNGCLFLLHKKERSLESRLIFFVTRSRCACFLCYLAIRLSVSFPLTYRHFAIVVVKSFLYDQNLPYTSTITSPSTQPFRKKKKIDLIKNEHRVWIFFIFKIRSCRLYYTVKDGLAEFLRLKKIDKVDPSVFKHNTYINISQWPYRTIRPPYPKSFH